MNSRKYRAGQTVTMTPNRARATPKGRFEVVRLMPAEHGTYQYRIRSVMDGHERVVQESDPDGDARLRRGRAGGAGDHRVLGA
jgi:hypothetical protein